MDRIHVQSSHLSSVGYDVANSILEVEFLDGSVYQYFNVPEHLFQGLINAGSKGSYFNENIKKANYQYSKN